MKFIPTPLEGAYTVELEPRSDDRGFFARAFCQKEFADQQLENAVVQTNLAYTARKGTLRGMHYQLPPAAESKFIRCIRGAIWDVIVDLREDSPTYLQHFGLELNAQNRLALFVPESFAHGYLCLEDDTETLYQVSEFYTPGCETGFRYNDPLFDIKWPIEITTISEKDESWADFKPAK